MKLSVKLFLISGFWSWFAAAQSYTVQRLGFNTNYDEYGPQIYQGQILFVSDRKWQFLKEVKNRETQYLTNLFITSDDSIVKIFDQKLTTLFNEGPACFSNKLDTMYFTKNLDNKLRSGKNSKNTVGIFRTVRSNRSWSEPTAINLNNTKEFNDGHPFIDPSGKYLIFASDRPGGYGGSDLYVSKIEDGLYTTPINLGPEINSVGNESFPYTNAMGQLYFTSDKPGGIGGKDIYYSYNNKDGSWTTPINLPSPINSSADDFSFVSSKNETTGYFASSRNGSDDIFNYTFKFPTFEYCSEIQEPSYCYRFKELSQAISDTLPLRFKWSFGDGIEAYGNNVRHCYKDTGYYVIKLDLEDTTTGLKYANVANYELNLEREDLPYITALDTIQKGKSQKYSSLDTKLGKFNIIGTYWIMGDGQEYRGSTITHTYQKPGKYMPVLGLTVEDKVTKERSEICAYKTIEVLDVMEDISRIDQTGTLTPKSFEYNFSPLESNTLNSIDLDDEHFLYALQLNQSSIADTAKILEHLRKLGKTVHMRRIGNDSVSYEINYTKDPNKLYTEYEAMIGQGLTPELVGFDYRYLKVDSTIFNRISADELFELYYTSKNKSEVKGNLEVFFGLNQDNISSSNYRKLLKGIKGLKLSEHFLVIEGYTDASGGEQLNQRLALRRAINVKDALLKNGADEKKIQIFSRGEKFAEPTEEGDLRNEKQRKVVITFLQRK